MRETGKKTKEFTYRYVQMKRMWNTDCRDE
jgi:hypothetical protein